jgi:hypothetical protein
MQNIADAFVELLTNSIDAYKQTDNDTYAIRIMVDVVNRRIWVVDDALGLNAVKMAQCFLRVGSLTAAVNSRGYFSRGAKDICALGDVTIVGIKDGLLSKCFINTLGMGAMLISDEVATEEDREEYGIAANGLYFHVDLKESVDLVPSRIPVVMHHYALRDILSDSTNHVSIKVINGTNEEIIPLIYRYPVAQKVLDINFMVPGYNVPARFTLYKSNTAIQNQYDVVDDKYMNFGILVSTSTAIHMNTTLYPQLRYHPYINHVYGRIECEYITDLIKQLDLPPSEYDTVKNPYTIIDPNRLAGLNRNHPFTKALYKIPYERLQFVLETMEIENNSGNDINFSAINDIFNNLDIEFDLIYFTTIPNPNSVTFAQRIYESIISQEVIDEDSELIYSKENIDLIYSSTPSKLSVKPKLKITITKVPLRYDYIYYKTKDGYNIEISTASSLLSKYVTFNINNEIQGLNNPEALIHLCYLIKEAMTRIMVTKHFITTEYSEISPDIVFNKYEFYMNKIEKDMDRVMISNTSTSIPIE